MQIHVVRQGESLWGISQAYEVPPEQLIRANQITAPNRLVIGQTIVIPIWGSFHWVQPGEGLWHLSQLYHVSVQELANINQLENPSQIPIGLRLYIPHRQRPVIDLGAYLHTEITGSASSRVVNDDGEYLTYLPIFSYTVGPEGSLNTLNEQPIINAAYHRRVAPIMVIANIDSGRFSRELATRILTNEALQDRLLDEAIEIMDEKGYLGLDFDFEFLGAENRTRYNQFMRKASSKLRTKGYFLTCALPAKTSSNQTGILAAGHDYEELGETADFVYLMTYDWGWVEGPPMAVSPINEVRRVIEYAVSVMPREKVMMGIPLYGYDWKLPFVEGVTKAKAVLPQKAIERARKYQVPIKYDYTAQSPYFNYYDEQGIEHEVWFEDARSIQAKMDLVKAFNIRGYFNWALGFAFPQNWLLVQDNFRVRKRV